jgi:hypothetical protein
VSEVTCVKRYTFALEAPKNFYKTIHLHLDQLDIRVPTRDNVYHANSKAWLAKGGFLDPKNANPVKKVPRRAECNPHTGCLISSI